LATETLVSQMIVKSLIAASCAVRFVGISNARERIMHARLGTRTWSIFSLADGLLTPSTHPLQCTRRIAPELLTFNYARIFPNQCIFTGAKSATELDYTFRIYMQNTVNATESVIHVPKRFIITGKRFQQTDYFLTKF